MRKYVCLFTLLATTLCGCVNSYFKPRPYVQAREYKSKYGRTTVYEFRNFTPCR